MLVEECRGYVAGKERGGAEEGRLWESLESGCVDVERRHAREITGVDELAKLVWKVGDRENGLVGLAEWRIWNESGCSCG